MESNSFHYNSSDIYYEVTGAGEPVVFVHGFTLDHRTWQPQVETLCDDYQMITYDARGFGRSSLPDGPYNHAADLRALLHHLDVPQAHLVGLSMGGRIATNFALTYPDVPTSLTLMDAALDGYASEVDWNVHAQEEGIERAKENWLNHEVFAATRKHPAVVEALSTIVDDYSGWHWQHSDQQDPGSTNARNRLHEITIPTLIITGEDDVPYFHNIARVLAAGIKHARKTTIPNAGHMVNMEAPEAINKLLADFLASPASAQHSGNG